MQYLVVCKPRAPYASRLDTYARVVEAETKEGAIRAAWQEDKKFNDLDGRYCKTAAQPLELGRTYKIGAT